MFNHNYILINKPNPSVMEAKNFLRIFILFIFAGSLFLTSCVKEGPMGLPGADGKDGVDGIDGASGTASCLACHNNTARALVTNQYSMSDHLKGTSVNTAGTRTNCTACHSHDGFVASIDMGLKDFTSVTPAMTFKATAFKCESCHTTHRTFDFSADGPDYALRTIAPVKMLAQNSVVLDMGKSSNLCVECHQPRAVAPTPDTNGNFFVSSGNYGPHYGPQSVVLEGIWGYHHLGGTTAFPGRATHAHRKNASCTSCHMHDASGTNGGHTWNVGVESCKSCHSDANTLDYKGIKTEVAGLMNTLKTKLTEKGALNASGSPVAGTYPIAVAGALFNYRLIYGDHSNGIHNPSYTKALLKNSIEALN